MVSRFFDWKKHLAALVIALFIFTIGILIGSNFNTERVRSTEEFIQKQKADYESLQLQYAFINLDLKGCSGLTSALESNLRDLEDSRIKLETYSKDNEKDFKTIQREYMLAEIRYWLLARQTKKACSTDTVSVLFFYQNDDVCDDCAIQGTILTKLKDMFKDKLLVFSLDADSDEKTIGILKKAYNISKTPGLVIEDSQHDGLVELEKLKNLICSNYKDKGEKCGL